MRYNPELPLTTLPLQSLIDERHRLAPHYSGQSKGHSDFPGQRISHRRGQGIEFTDLRLYTDGDDVRHIDWNVTARSNEAYTRLYREEREHTTTAVVDMRPCMFSGSCCLRAVAAGRLAASVLWQACDAGDRCAALVYSERGLHYTRPLAGHRGALKACELIATEFSIAADNRSPRHNHEPIDPPLSQLLGNLNRPGQTGGTHYLISGFDTSDDTDFPKRLAEAGVAARSIAILLLDPIETSALPQGVYPYKTPQRQRSFSANRSNQDALAENIRRLIAAKVFEFEQATVPLLIADTNSSTASLLAQLRQRSLL